MQISNLHILLIGFVALLASCNHRTSSKSPAESLSLNAEYLQEDMCHCYMVYGYSNTIIDSSCLFGKYMTPYPDWISLISESEIDSVKAGSSYLKLLFEYDSIIGKKFKQRCFDRKMVDRRGKAFFELKENAQVALTDQALEWKVRTRTSDITSTILDELYNPYGIGQSVRVPKIGEKPNLIIVYIDFEKESFGLDPIFAVESEFVQKLGPRVANQILSDPWLSENLSHLSYPLNYWEPHQIDPSVQ